MVGNGMAKKTIKNTAIGVLTTALLIFLGTVGKSGLKSMIQEEAKQAVRDSVGGNTTNIAELKRLVENNIKEDTEVHPKIKSLENELEAARREVSQMREDMRVLSKKLDDLTKILIEYMKTH